MLTKRTRGSSYEDDRASSWSSESVAALQRARSSRVPNVLQRFVCVLLTASPRTAWHAMGAAHVGDQVFSCARSMSTFPILHRGDRGSDLIYHARHGQIAMSDADTETVEGAAASRSDARWAAMLKELRDYAMEWGNADPPLNTKLGRWCALQRQRQKNRNTRSVPLPQSRPDRSLMDITFRRRRSCGCH